MRSRQRELPIVVWANAVMTLEDTIDYRQAAGAGLPPSNSSGGARGTLLYVPAYASILIPGLRRSIVYLEAATSR